MGLTRTLPTVALSMYKHTNLVKHYSSSDLLTSFPTDCDSLDAVHTLHHPLAPGEGFRQQFIKGIEVSAMMYFIFEIIGKINVYIEFHISMHTFIYEIEHLAVFSTLLHVCCHGFLRFISLF